MNPPMMTPGAAIPWKDSTMAAYFKRIRKDVLGFHGGPSFFIEHRSDLTSG